VILHPYKRHEIVWVCPAIFPQRWHKGIVKEISRGEVLIEYIEKHEKCYWWSFHGSTEILRLPNLKYGKFWINYLSLQQTRQWQLLPFKCWTIYEMNRWLIDADFIDDLLDDFGKDLISETALLSVVKSELLDMINELILISQIESLFWECEIVKTKEKKRRELAETRMKSRETSGRYKIFTKTLWGEQFTLDVSEETTIEKLKEQICDVILLRSNHGVGVQPSEQRVVYLAKLLQDSKTLGDCEIRADATIHVVRRLRSGY